jgi:phospholipase C
LPAGTPRTSGRAHVFLIVLENASYHSALQEPFIASLAVRYAVATNYYAVAHPSVPNYLALSSGDTFGVRDDAYHQLPAVGIGQELTAHGISWRAYMEGFTGDCFSSPYPYALKHNPFAYYGGACPPNVVSMQELGPDLSGSTPQFSWITPGLCNDGHDCPLSTTDQWLSSVVPQITGSAAWRDGGVLFITWDEANTLTNQVATLVVRASLDGQRITADANHYSLLASIAAELKVPAPGRAASTARLPLD